MYTGGKRTPKFSHFWKVHVFLLAKHNDDFAPSSAELSAFKSELKTYLFSLSFPDLVSIK